MRASGAQSGGSISANGTDLPSGDVRIHGEYWRVSGPPEDMVYLGLGVVADRAVEAADQAGHRYPLAFPMQ